MFSFSYKKKNPTGRRNNISSFNFLSHRKTLALSIPHSSETHCVALSTSRVNRSHRSRTAKAGFSESHGSQLRATSVNEPQYLNGDYLLIVAAALALHRETRQKHADQEKDNLD